MLSSYKFRLYPSKTLQRKLFEQRELCRWLYNQLLEKINHAREKGERIHQGDTQALIVRLKDEKHELKTVYSKVLQMVNHQLWANIRGLAVRRRKGHRIGRLRFKGPNQFKALNFNQSGFKIDVKRKRLVLSKVGEVTIKLHRPIDGKVKAILIKQYPSGKWFALLQVEAEAETLPRTGQTVGIDIGLRHFATDSDGRQIENPRFYEKSLHRIRLCHRRLSRKQRGSKNREKLRGKLARAYERMVNQRDDFLHKLSCFYIKHYDKIAVEDLQVQNMVRNHQLAQRILDASWGKFFHMLSFKAASAGKTLVRINPWGTSQEYRYGALDRDFNASLNIHERGLGRPHPPVERGPLRRIPASAVVVGQVLAMKQEAIPFMVG